MQNISIPLVLTVVFVLPSVTHAYQPKRIQLTDKDETGQQAFMDIHVPVQPNGTVVLICPGGGYGGLAWNAEGDGIAVWLRSHGITGVALNYRLPKGRNSVPLSDAQKAITELRRLAVEMKFEKIGVMGFSAGGHLASTLATHGKTKRVQPDFAVLIYPVITMGDHTHLGSRNNLLGPDPSGELIQRFSNQLQVDKQTCPTFLAHAIDDKPVPPINSRLFHDACKKQGVPSVYLELPDGGHGLNGYKGASWDKWQSESLKWISQLR
ncbi:MAG: alpha/beta hydrolase [Rubripirellula sp.]|nr:alpha/beta hydrolase [Rubripirellula sp.]